MQIILANPRGFCAGVNMAIQCVEEALKFVGTPLFVYHEIVHNRHVVERFVREGVIFVDHIDEVPADSTVIFSAHGVSKAVREEAEQRGVDAGAFRQDRVHDAIGNFGDLDDAFPLLNALLGITHVSLTFWEPANPHVLDRPLLMSQL